MDLVTLKAVLLGPLKFFIQVFSGLCLELLCRVFLRKVDTYSKYLEIVVAEMCFSDFPQPPYLHISQYILIYEKCGSSSDNRALYLIQFILRNGDKVTII